MSTVTVQNSPRQPLITEGVDPPTLDELASYAFTYMWLIELARDLHDGRVRVEEVFAPLPKEGIAETRGRITPLLRTCVQALSHMQSTIPSTYQELQEGEEISFSRGVETLFSAYGTIDELRLHNAPMLELIEGMAEFRRTWVNGAVSDSELHPSNGNQLTVRCQRAYRSLLEMRAFPEKEPLSQFENQIRATFEAFRANLIETGLRANNFLNYHPSTGERGVDIQAGTSESVYHALVLEGGTLGFSAINPEEQPAQHELLGTTVLQTIYSTEALESRLLNTHQIARSYIDSHGSNALYLALGMLHWSSPDDPTAVRRAPLVLVPVELCRENATTPFRVIYLGDELEENRALAKRLHDEFGIELPPFPPELDLHEYFFQVREQLGHGSSFKVEEHEMALGVFQSSIRMYEDLDQNLWSKDRRPWKHPLIVQVLGGGLAHSDAVPQGRIDELVDPRTHISVFGCDSSQDRVLHYVAAGRSAMVQGPPGSGKSWAIADFLAQVAYSGKTALFVSAKPAALEVVARRLRVAGLEDIVLAIPRHDVTKKTILNELRRTVALGEPLVQKTDGAVERFIGLRAELNAHADALMQPVGRSSLSAYDVAGRFLRSSAPSVPLSGAAMDEWSEEDFRAVRQSLQEVVEWQKAHGDPRTNLFWGSDIATVEHFSEEKFIGRVESTQVALSKAKSALQNLCNRLEITAPHTIVELSKLVVGIQELGTLSQSPAFTLIDPVNSAWATSSEAISRYVKAGLARALLNAQWHGRVMQSSWSYDPTTLYSNLQRLGSHWYNMFRPIYWSTRKEVNGLFTTKFPKTHVERLKIVGTIKAVRMCSGRMESNTDAVKGPLSHIVTSPNTVNWKELSALTSKLIRWHQTYMREPWFEALSRCVQDHAAFMAVQRLSSELTVAATDASNAEQELLAELSFAGNHSPLGDTLTAKEDRLALWRSGWKSLVAWAGLNRVRGECKDLGASETFTHVVNLEAKIEQAVNGLEHHWLNALLKRVKRERVVLSNFDSTAHERSIGEFIAAERDMFNLNAAEIVRRHWRQIPRIDTGGQVGALNREISRRARNRPISELSGEAPDVLSLLKPIIMVTPRSLSEFISPKMRFDFYVGDEESQKELEEALGGMLRCDHALVVGDTKQMGPSRVFKKATEDTKVSVLDQFTEAGAPRFMFTGSYRFKDPTLMQCSNRLFYDGKLRVYPTPRRSSSDLGLQYVYEANLYEGGGINRAEAQRVAGRVIEHARAAPHLSLGVAAFSQEQATLILRDVDKLRKSNLELEPFFAAHPDAPFFVRNLENVQGDERDIMFVSTAYGRGKSGRLRLTFGTLNQPGGEKGLNVLFTRARLRCEIFTAINPDEMDLTEEHSEGVKALKAYLLYAKRSELKGEDLTTSKTVTPLEEFVRMKIEDLGYEVHPHVGTSECHVNLGVVSRENQDRFILGVLIDSPQYQQAGSARDRNRITREALESLGWQVHYSWSFGWINNPESELRRLTDAIRSAGQSEIVNSRNLGQLQPRVVERSPTPSEIRSARGEPYRLAELEYQTPFKSITEIPAQTLQRLARDVVDVEAPVHVKEVYRRLKEFAELERVPARIDDLLTEACEHAHGSRGITRRGDFLYVKDRPIIARDRTLFAPSNKKLDLIAPEEIEAALVFVIGNAIGMRRREVVGECVEFLGFKSVPQDAPAIIAPMLEKLLDTGEIIEQHGRIALVRQSGGSTRI